MSLQHSRKNPMRLPDWRWQRADAIARGEQYSRLRDDPVILRMSKFARSYLRYTYDSVPDFAGLERLEANFPDLFWAHDIATNPAEHMILIRLEIEARICAEQPAEEIAALTGYEPAVINMFEAGFFDVIGRLKQDAFFQQCVVGSALHSGLSAEQDYGILWKIFGRRGGPHVLNFIISTFNIASRPVTREGVDAFCQDAIRDNMMRKLLLALHTMKINSFTAADIISNGMKMLEVERTLNNGKHSEATILNNIHACMTSVNFSVGGIGGATRNDNSLIKQLDKAGVELPGQRLIEVTGNNASDIVSDYANLKFPEAEAAE